MASFDDGVDGCLSSAEVWQMFFPDLPIPGIDPYPIPVHPNLIHPNPADQSGMASPQGNGPGVPSALGWQAAQPSHQMPGPVQHAAHGNGPGVPSALGWQTAQPSHQMPGPVQHAAHGNPPLPPPLSSALPPNGWINSPGKIPVMIPRAFFEQPPLTKYRCAECEAEFDAELALRNHQLATKHERQKDEDTNQFTCAECGKGLGTFEKMRSHKNNVHGVKLDCRINDCQYRGFSVSEMVEHMYQRHNHECPYPACGWDYPPPPHPSHQATQNTQRHGLTGFSAVAVHWNAHHTDDEHNSPCPYPTCAFVAKDMGGLMRHLHHHRINHYSCSVCGHMEKSIQPRLARHIDSHHNGLGDIIHTTMPKLTRVFLDERQNE